MAKQRVKTVKTVALYLDPLEVHYLHGILQNPVSKDDDMDEPRIEIWSALDRALKGEKDETL